MINLKTTLLLVAAVFTLGTTSAQKAPQKIETTIIELDTYYGSGWCVTGKGPGQDGAINPFGNGPSIAWVRNIGNETFGIRTETQKDRDILKLWDLAPGETRAIALRKGDVLYFDYDENSKALVGFQPQRLI